MKIEYACEILDNYPNSLCKYTAAEKFDNYSMTSATGVLQKKSTLGFWYLLYKERCQYNNDKFHIFCVCP